MYISLYVGDFICFLLLIYHWPHHVACGILAPRPDQGSIPHSLHWKLAVLTIGPPGESYPWNTLFCCIPLLPMQPPVLFSFPCSHPPLLLPGSSLTAPYYFLLRIHSTLLHKAYLLCTLPRLKSQDLLCLLLERASQINERRSASLPLSQQKRSPFVVPTYYKERSNSIIFLLCRQALEALLRQWPNEER